MTQPEIITIATTPRHIRDMAEVMHEQTAETAKKMGCEPRKLLWQSYKQSFMCKSIFINGKIGAIFGIGGILFGETGRPWLILSDEVNDYPFKVAFIYKKELEKFQHMFPILEDYVNQDDEKAIRMLELMKFNVSKNVIPVGDVVFRRAERRA
jgi:hypothetical protein